MDDRNTAAPSVVLAMAVHDPGDTTSGWFPEVLASIAAQDYPTIQCLFLVTEGAWTESVSSAITSVLPEASIRVVTVGASFGNTVNQVLKIVEGNNGFFLLMHDDVALEPTAVREMVLELYRSNAGVVGPKLVAWDDPTMLQHVGYAMDATGELDPVIEAGERDQEQHDAVSDVFVLPSACLLIRADLFRTLGGFAPEIEYIGDDIDLCWRAHLTGARVVVVPAAKARHREQLGVRAESLDRQKLEARNRVNTVASLTGLARLPIVFLRMFLSALVGLAIGLFTGQSRRPRYTLTAMVTLPLHLRGIVRRRRALRAHRHVPDSEIKHLQLRGSARWRVFMRHRVATGHADLSISGIADLAGEVQDRGREEVMSQPRSVTLMWFGLLVVLLIGSRSLITDGVSAIGQFQYFGGGPRFLLREHLSGWWTAGFGASSSGPTGILMIAVAGALSFGRMALLHTGAIVGLLFVGPIAMWNFSRSFGEYKSRVAATLVYAAVPLPYAAIASGQWDVLAVYATLPILLFYSQQPRSSRNAIKVAILCATLAAFVPVAAFLLVAGFAIWAAVSRGAGGTSGESAQYLRFAVIAVVGPLILLMPWSLHYFTTDAWSLINSGSTNGAHLGPDVIARFGIGSGSIGALSWFLYLPVLPAVLIASGRRFEWAVKAIWWILPFGGLALASDAGVLNGWLPDARLMLPFVASGLAIAAAVAVSIAASDVRRARIGWRQPVAALSMVGLSVGVIPLLVNSLDGRWNQRSVSINQLLAQIPNNAPEGDSRVLYLGDARVLPLGARALDGQLNSGDIAYAVADDGDLAVRNYWAPSGSLVTNVLETAVKEILDGNTLRGGRLLGPLGIRYVVVPVIDGGQSTRSNPIAAPVGLIESLTSQLDLRRRYQASDLLIFENSAWLPVVSQLAEPAIASSQEAGIDSLIATDFGLARVKGKPLFQGASPKFTVRSQISEGVVHFAAPLDDNWKMKVNGAVVQPRLAFGSTMAYEVAAQGSGTLEYDTSIAHQIMVLSQMIIWGACFVHVANLRRWRRRNNKAGELLDTSTAITFAGTDQSGES